MSNYTYMVTNNINGKVYVGSHSWDGEGLDPNYYGSGKIIKRAVEKYGKENFQVEVLYYYDTVEECRADEERILTEYNVRDCPHSYNIKNAAIGWEKGLERSEETRQKMSQATKGKKHRLYGKHHTEETRKKISQAHKGKTVSEETRRKLSQSKKGERHPNYGKHLSDETRKKLSQANKGKTLSEEHRQKISQAMTGKTLSEEHRKNLSQALKGEKHPNYGKHLSEETRKKLSQANKGEKHPLYGKHLSEETRKKISQAHKGKTLSEETRRKLSQANKGRAVSEETRKKISQAQKNFMTPVVAIDTKGNIKIFKSQAECSRVLGVNCRKVNDCLKGRRKSTGGYTFKYVEQLESGI